MNEFFLIQLIVSFLAGGSFIALLSFMAEKVNESMAGIVLAFPSTVALGFFFMGWTISPDAVAKIIPSTFIPLGLAMLFVAIYPYIAEFISKHFKDKVLQIIISFLLSIGVWFALSVPLIVYEFNNFIFGVMGYIFLTTLAHLVLKKKNYVKPVALKYTKVQKMIRATFVGFIVFVIVLLSKVFGPFWGGMFSMFPAAFTSVVIIIHWHYGVESLFPTMRNTAIGSLSLFGYAVVTMFVFPKYGYIIGTFFAYLVSLIITLLLVKIQPKAFTS
jgi:MFS family permease